jgi:hypothetical protein
MRGLSEFAGVIVVGFGAFFGWIVFVLALVFLWVCGVATALCLMVAAFAGVMYAITGKPHDATLGLVYLGYATVPFVVTFVLAYYRSKITTARRQRQALLLGGSLQLAQDASFTPDANRR